MATPSPSLPPDFDITWLTMPTISPAMFTYDWFISQAYLVFAANVEAAKFLETFKAFPPRQRAATFSIDQAVEKMRQSLSGN